MRHVSRLVLCVSLAPVLAAPPRTAAGAAVPELFETSDRCIACHNGLFTAAARDVSIGSAWRSEIMANAARDPYWQAAVRRELADHAEESQRIQDECSTCHMPMARFDAHARGRAGSVVDHLPIRLRGGRGDRLAADGVSCSLCHQITPEGFGQPQSFVGGFAIDTQTPWGERRELGPFASTPGLVRIMQSSSLFRPEQADWVRRSELCATCHTLYTTAFAEGRAVGRLPEQVPYLEWLHSSWRDAQSCQDCHMEVLDEPVPIASVLGPTESGFAQHAFPGGNFFVLRMLGRYRDELAVEALPGELEAAADHTAAFLRERAASLHVAATRRPDGRLDVDVTVENLAGHKLPTAYPSRRAWIHLRVRDASGATVFESGRLEPSGAIAGNDNDEDALRYEPHHDVIDDASQVQIYEDIMADAQGRVTTGLSSAIRYLKDNRLAPQGFDKIAAGPDFAVVGEARDDADFQGGSDVVHYRVAARGAAAPLSAEVELWYQPIGFRWAHNLEGYAQAEPRRFVGWYAALSTASALVLAEASASAR